MGQLPLPFSVYLVLRMDRGITSDPAIETLALTNSHE